MIEGIYISGAEELNTVYELRKEVLQEEQGILPQIEQDGLDRMAVHALAYEKGMPAAAGRVLYDGEVFRLSRIAVRKQFRGMGMGDFVVRMLINKAMLSGAEEIYVSTLQESKGFFEHLGFQVCGACYENGGRSFLPMYLKNDMLHTCCGCDSE